MQVISKLLLFVVVIVFCFRNTNKENPFSMALFI